MAGTKRCSHHDGDPCGSTLAKERLANRLAGQRKGVPSFPGVFQPACGNNPRIALNRITKSGVRVPYRALCLFRVEMPKGTYPGHRAKMLVTRNAIAMIPRMIARVPLITPLTMRTPRITAITVRTTRSAVPMFFFISVAFLHSKDPFSTTYYSIGWSHPFILQRMQARAYYRAKGYDAMPAPLLGHPGDGQVSRSFLILWYSSLVISPLA